MEILEGLKRHLGVAQKFEYALYESGEDLDGRGVVKFLSAANCDGWELVGVRTINNKSEFYLKRELLK